MNTGVRENILVKIGGRTGEGIDSMGEMLVYIAKECGLEGNTFRSFPTVIVGGNTTYEAHISTRRIYSRGDEVDVLIALHQESMDELVSEMASDAIAIYDPDVVKRIPEEAPADRLIGIPMRTIAKEVGNEIMRNMVGLGVMIKLLDLDLEAGFKIIEKRFGDKGDKIVQQNKEALQRGYDYEDERLKTNFTHETPAEVTPKLLISGNEAMSYGALAADCRVFAGYPITPASDILEWMAKKLPEVGGYCLQMEDEIAALCTVIGSSFAGVRAMTASSGPGISLMTEAMGLAGMTETPVVIIDTQRPGPSAGMPTRHEQSDIKHLIHGSHGEFPRIVISPGTVEECIEDMVAAFNLADIYQCPVIVAADQDLALRKQTVNLDEIDVDSFSVNRGKLAQGKEGEEYLRYADTPDGVSPRAFPGQEHLIFATSGDEHHEDGSIDLYDPLLRTKAVDKRMRKLEHIDPAHYEPYKVYGPNNASTMLVGMGSTKGPLLEVIRRLPDTKYLQIRRLWPFPAEELALLFDEVETIIVVEHNYQAQLAYLIQAELPVHHKIRNVLKYDGTPFTPKELLEEVNQCLLTKIS